MKKAYPFDPAVKHHLIIALGLAIWIFVFLYFTEPLDVHEFGDKEKLKYLPLYGLVGALAYLLMMPFQFWMFRTKQHQWSIQQEAIFFVVFIAASFVITRSVYLYIVMIGEPNPYTLDYYFTAIFLPAISTILPIVLIGRWAFGKYKEKKLEDQKIEIKGEGTYEGLRLLWNDLICVKADDNYVELTFLDYGVLKKQLIRTKLSKVSETHPQLLQTHRSYLINPYHFQTWKPLDGKQNLQLSHSIFAPVSKTYAPSVKMALNSTTK